MTDRVTVVDFGASNMLSVCRALHRCGAEVTVAERADEVGAADRLALPGVGAFANTMETLIERGLAEPVKRFLDTGRPFLGICVGMQILLEGSEEFGWHAGLGAISGAVRAIPSTGASGNPHKIPHIGWNVLHPANENEKPGWEGTLLDGIGTGDSVYFLHSYTAWPEAEERRLADAVYNGRRIAAVLRDGNAYGCQFHPEKSGRVGLRILENFLRLD